MEDPSVGDRGLLAPERSARPRVLLSRAALAPTRPPDLPAHPEPLWERTSVRDRGLQAPERSARPRVLLSRAALAPTRPPDVPAHPAAHPDSRGASQIFVGAYFSPRPGSPPAPLVRRGQASGSRAALAPTRPPDLAAHPEPLWERTAVRDRGCRRRGAQSVARPARCARIAASTSGAYSKES